jgi:hypothetical protein
MNVNNWGRHRTAPMVHWLSRIIDFLGYVAYDPSWTAGERLRAGREATGLSRRRMAKVLGFEEGMVKWERGKGRSGD